MSASYGGSIGCMRLLLDSGAQVNNQTKVSAKVHCLLMSCSLVQRCMNVN